MTFTLIIRLLHTMTSSLVPLNVRGMKVLDRSKFLRNIKVPVLKVSEQTLAKITPLCKSYFLKLERFKPVQSSKLDGEESKKNIYLNPDTINSWTDIEENVRKDMSVFEVNESNFNTQEIQLTYDNWSFDIIFNAVLPENEEKLSSFSHIGHIIHLNLRDHLLDYRFLIGEVLLDKIKSCRTVVNKSNTINNTYRNFSMELLAGDEDYIVTVKENQCNFHFDFSKVYWNPRLCKEHERILSYLKQGDVLFDIFCGVGPFSIPAAKRKTIVYANDLNPESYKWLNHNAEKNKIKNQYFKSYNMDGKEFILTVLKDYLLDLCNEKRKLDDSSRIQITMNLPGLAVEFLKYFKGLVRSENVNNLKNEIIVYVYCFAATKEIAKEMVCENIAIDISKNIIEVFDVRNVSPKKEMMRVTIKLTNDILCINSDDHSEPPLKKLCVESK
ncbi:tRNA (guanine(37)-N1)-methyltransferase [Bombyx mandarina]|uniref:tRNA (guanine(37)-N1)-methyltransferase n=1 Tax=Bombyx mandarina TaxID=7092 RepID=A0A6J2JAF2_BOMMA|nr:tRNA (guanine(37)-N1)-methyltransferase [Bombyx mandarina]